MANGEEKVSNISAGDALEILRSGNARFSKNIMSLENLSHQERREKSVKQQNPLAIILSCSDSRVPSEFVFDQGLGDLFVIRVAGNIVAPSIIGSVEFAAATFGTQLVVVMGHSGCGAISAALNAELHGHDVISENVQDIVDRISPSIRPLVDLQKESSPVLSHRDLLAKCVKANVWSSVQQLQHGSRIIEDMVREKKLKVVGAEYLLESGEVQFFESPKPSRS